MTIIVDKFDVEIQSQVMFAPHFEGQAGVCWIPHAEHEMDE